MDLFDKPTSETEKINPFVETPEKPDFWFEVEKAKKKHGKANVHKHINDTIPDSKRRLNKVLERIRSKRNVIKLD